MPSRVAEILLEAARQQGEGIRERGRIWGGMAEQLGQIPEQAMAFEQQRKRQALQAQNLMSVMATREQERQMRGLQIGELQRKTGEITKLDALANDPGIIDEQGNLNRDVLLTRARESGLGLTGVTHVTGLIDTLQKSREDSDKRQREADLANRDDLGETAQYLLEHPDGGPDAFHLWVTAHAGKALPAPQAQNYASLTDPQQMRHVLQQAVANSPKMAAKAEAANKPLVVAPGAAVTSEAALRKAQSTATTSGGGASPVLFQAPPESKTEWETFKNETYPRLFGKSKWADLTPAEQTAGMTKFHTEQKDPTTVALQQSALALGNAMRQLTIGQQPTRADAEAIAQQVHNHQMAPSQAMAMGGFGTAGAAFKRMVGLELTKLDPKFSWEQAESDYQFGKTPAFQTTTRFMTSVQESMPRLLDNAKKLGNVDIRVINAAINAGKNQMNNVDLKRFTTDRILVADEIAKLLQGGGTGAGTSDAKLKQASDILKTSDSVPAIAAALEEASALISYRAKALTRGTYMEGKAPEPQRFTETTAVAPPPNGQRTLQKYGATYTWDGSKYVKQ